MENATHSLEGVNPSCGDDITLQLRVKDGRIEDAGFIGSGCAISQASASLMIDLVKGRSVEDARRLIGLYFDMIKGKITPEQLDDLEDEANQLIYDNVPVHVFYPSEEELAQLDYRSKKELTGAVRIVEIPGGDICACCGTHVETTGEVGIIKLRTMINYKGGVRISMLCGRRALVDYRERLKDEIRISNLLSAKLALVPEAVEKLKNEIQEKDFANGRLWQQLLEKKAESYPESNDILAVFEENLSPVQLRQLATMLYEKKKGKIAGVFSGKEEEQLYQYALGSSQADMRKLSKAMNGALNGRGGGSNLMAQGSFKASAAEIREVWIREAGNME